MNQNKWGEYLFESRVVIGVSKVAKALSFEVHIFRHCLGAVNVYFINQICAKDVIHYLHEYAYWNLNQTPDYRGSLPLSSHFAHLLLNDQKLFYHLSRERI